jgi:hypothetical protein
MDSHRAFAPVARVWRFRSSLVLFALSLLHSPGQNLVSNPGFEAGTTNWFVSGGTITAAPGGHSGAAAAYVSGSSPTVKSVTQFIAGGLRSGRTYRWSAWTRSGDLPPFQRTVALNFYYIDATGGHFIPVASHTPMNSWTEVSATFDFVATGGVTNARIAFETGISQFPYSFNLDDVSLVDASPGLTIRPTNGSVIVSWPTNATGYSLQRKLDLSLPISWVTVTNEVQTDGGVFSVTLPATGPMRVFRLKK